MEVTPLGGPWRGDQARGDGVAPDRTVELGEVLGECVECGFGHAVRKGRPHRPQTGDGGDVDDAALGALQVRHRGLAHPPGAVDIDLDRLEEDLVGERSVIGVIDPSGPASVIDKDVEPAETFDRALDERLTLCLVGDVGLDVVPVGRQRRCDSLTSLDRRRRVHDDVRPLGGEGMSGRLTDATRRARDQCNLAVQ